MAPEQAGRTAVDDLALDDAPERVPRARVHAGGRLVQQHDRRRAHQRDRDRQLALVAAAVRLAHPARPAAVDRKPYHNEARRLCQRARHGWLHWHILTRRCLAHWAQVLCQDKAARGTAAARRGVLTSRPRPPTASRSGHVLEEQSVMHRRSCCKCTAVWGTKHGRPGGRQNRRIDVCHTAAERRVAPVRILHQVQPLQQALHRGRDARGRDAAQARVEPEHLPRGQRAR
jgi:hypothetical protein